MSEELKAAGKGRKVFVLILVLVLIPCAILLFHGTKSHYIQLPILGERVANAPGDTTYFTVPPFSFTDEDGKPFTDKDTKGKITVADFFFTRCTSICPRMSAHMQQLQLMLDAPRYKDVLFLSHTVDPKHDTPEVLKAYAKRLEADPKRWKFLTGSAPDIYRQGNIGYLLSAGADSSAAENFIHSPEFVLVDKQHHIRGMYDGTSSDEMQRLKTDIDLLLHEEQEPSRAGGK